MTEYYSLKQRLGRNLLAYMLAVMILLLLASNFVIRSLVNDYVASRLEHDVETLVHALRQDEQGGWFLDPTRSISGCAPAIILSSGPPMDGCIPGPCSTWTRNSSRPEVWNGSRWPVRVRNTGW